MTDANIDPALARPRRETSTSAAFARLPALSLVAIATGFIYLGWRVAATRSGSDPWTYWLLLVAEAFGIVRLSVELLLVGRRSDAPAPNSLGSASTMPACDVIVVARDEPMRVLRTCLLAARHVRGVRSVTIIDVEARRDLAVLAARLELAYRTVGPDRDLVATADEVLAGFNDALVIVVEADCALLADAAERLGTMVSVDVGAVAGVTAEANAARHIDHTGMGDSELWRRQMTPRLAATGALPTWGGVVLLRRDALMTAGGFASVDGFHLRHTATKLRANGFSIAATSTVVARRLAPGSLAVARHRYARELHQRLRRLVTAPRPSPRALAGISEWSALLSPLRAVQRIAFLVVIWAVLLDGATPLSASWTIMSVAWCARVVIGVAARYVVGRDRGFQPWLLNDLRLLPTDVAIGLRVLQRGWTPPLLAEAPPGGRAMRLLPRVLQASTSIVVMAAATGFVRVVPGMGGVAALGGGVVFLTASNLARRELRRTQFRQWFRSDTELEVVDRAGVRVVGLSPFGFDVLSSGPIAVGDALAVCVVLSDPTRHDGDAHLRGIVRRAGAVAEGHAAYVRFDGLDTETEDAILEFLAATDFMASARPAHPMKSSNLLS